MENVPSPGTSEQYWLTPQFGCRTYCRRFLSIRGASLLGLSHSILPSSWRLQNHRLYMSDLKGGPNCHGLYSLDHSVLDFRWQIPLKVLHPHPWNRRLWIVSGHNVR